MPGDLVPGRDLPVALLWDFDGTLVESEEPWFAAESRLMGEWGHGWTQEQHVSLIGQSLRDSAANLIQTAGRADLDPDEYADVLTSYALDDMAATGTPWRHGADDLLFAARAAGVRCALVSSSYERVLARFVDGLPAGTFDVVVGGDTVGRGKPAPDPYLAAVDRLGVTARDCLAIEDSQPGTASTEAAGIATLGVPFAQPIDPGPRRVVRDTLAGLTLAEVGRVWTGLRDA